MDTEEEGYKTTPCGNHVRFVRVPAHEATSFPKHIHTAYLSHYTHEEIEAMASDFQVKHQ